MTTKIIVTKKSFKSQKDFKGSLPKKSRVADSNEAIKADLDLPHVSEEHDGLTEWRSNGVIGVYGSPLSFPLSKGTRVAIVQGLP
ncbi:MAG TPA: hypothetical protein VHE10_02510 [Candidatus Paceibacterota bacterium]|nr:hypothetical protein [Candidatus Paceibacterota bacterium]